EFLRQRLRQVHPELEPELHTRAARWFLHERSGDEALAHAEASGDRTLVIEVLEDILTDAVMRGEVTAAERWFRAATTEEAILHPGIALPRATLEFLHLRARESERWLEHAERAIEAMPAIPSTDRAKREWAGHALFVRAFI